jgi:hypothetical protein
MYNFRIVSKCECYFLYYEKRKCYSITYKFLGGRKKLGYVEPTDVTGSPSTIRYLTSGDETKHVTRYSYKYGTNIIHWLPLNLRQIQPMMFIDLHRKPSHPSMFRKNYTKFVIDERG